MSALLHFFGTLDLLTVVVSVADVAIVTFIIYRVLLLLRGTRAGYMLIGLLVVAAVFLVAQKLSLTTLRWLLDNMTQYVIFIVIIVFQADIRRGLMRMGRRMFFQMRAEEEDTNTIEEIVRACEEMAGKHTGALIVFERDVDLTELVEAGTDLQARISKALLTNIFTPWPDNALHDGAVVIKEDLILQAGAVLPLSKQAGLDKALGTRHRAGVGITEESDAVVIVVSEEKGSISLCTGGMLHSSLTPPSLRRELLTRFTTEERSRAGWWRRTTRWLDERFSKGEPKKAVVAKTAPAPGRKVAAPAASDKAASDGEAADSGRAS